jgi:hypothetical protein
MNYRQNGRLICSQGCDEVQFPQIGRLHGSKTKRFIRETGTSRYWRYYLGSFDEEIERIIVMAISGSRSSCRRTPSAVGLHVFYG